MQFTYRPIGTIHSPFQEREGMPIQPASAKGAKGRVEVLEEFRAGLCDLEGFSHIIVLYDFHRSEGFDLEVVPFMDSQTRGVFSTRAPRRPNSIGISVLRLLGIQDGTLEVENIDILNGTPLLDIKPFVPKFDGVSNVKTGWLESSSNDLSDRKADGRFK
ncbi:MAG: tRNA (N6-threonylcarbamoyladenosine(37)-N6)-methyltransferase TrmO [Gemmatimonadales bacterium]|nr:tRNA (N6-threonylcarbamoyladenosine(37)-N6)-methyltransferase TrmO [Gemmatimonadales bacterium]